jgi:DNA repair protein RadA/Sms
LNAVLSRRVQINVQDQDVFVNVVGGLQIAEPAADLAVAVAIASGVRDRPVHADMVFVGEVGLSGELRAVSQLELRLKEAAKLGFKRCLVPKTPGRRLGEVPSDLEVVGCRSLAQALEVALMS